MRKFISILLPIIVFFITASFFGLAWAANLKFDKTTISVSNGETFQIAVIVDPSPDAITSTDVYISYDATALKATAVSAGSLFPTVTNDISASGKVYIAGLVNDAASSVTSAGTLATITFQALKETTITLSFDCSTSKVIKNDINATNVLNCSANGTSAVTIGSGSSSVPTSAVPTQLPQSGVFDNVVKFAIPGSILLILGSALRFIL